MHYFKSLCTALDTTEINGFGISSKPPKKTLFGKFIEGNIIVTIMKKSGSLSFKFNNFQSIDDWEEKVKQLKNELTEFFCPDQKIEDDKEDDGDRKFEDMWNKLKTKFGISSLVSPGEGVLLRDVMDNMEREANEDKDGQS
jgi:hypothetical protein